MTWTDIANDNPKAFNEWFKQCDSPVTPEEFLAGDYGYQKFPIRILYDFFDEQAIFITTSFDGVAWIFNIYNPDEFYVNTGIWNNRSEAEAAAFIIAFEWLEEKLNLR